MKFNAGKFVLYIVGKGIAAAIALGAIALGFFTAMNSMDVNVMAKDAFTKRASVILSPLDNDDTELLPKIFTEEYLLSSGLDTQRTNASYEITNYAQRTDVDFVIVWPWSTRVELEVRDVVESISANLVDSTSTAQLVDSFIGSGRYKVVLEKQEDGSWKISDIELLEEITPSDVRPVPTPEPEESTADESETADDGEATGEEDETEGDVEG